MGADQVQESLQRIASALESIDSWQKEERLARDRKTINDNRREFIALVTIGLTALLVIVSASNVVSRFGPYAQQLKDYQPLVAVGFTIFVALIYRAFQLRVIPLELVVGLGLGVMIASALTLAPVVHSGWIGGVLLLVFIGVALALLNSVKWDLGAERAALISAGVILVILWAVGLITVRALGANSWQLGFVGQTLLSIDSAFPKLVVMDVLGTVAPGLALVVLYLRWGFFKQIAIQLARSLNPEDYEDALSTILVGTTALVLFTLISNNPFGTIAHMPWPFVG